MKWYLNGLSIRPGITTKKPIGYPRYDVEKPGPASGWFAFYMGSQTDSRLVLLLAEDAAFCACLHACRRHAVEKCLESIE